MRKYLKNSILEIFRTMHEAHSSINQFIDRMDTGNAMLLLEDCLNTAEEICTIIEESEGKGFIAARLLEEYRRAVSEVSVSISDGNFGVSVGEVLDDKLVGVVNSVKNDISVRLEVVFCPYKASMWDSMESVWRAAENDPDCDAYVVAIPYYDRNPDYSFGEFHYEGGELPDNVPVTHYDAYNFEMRRPDIVFIHNPYDDGNFVTSIDPRFYSGELKKYTECLVYVPYFLFPKQPEVHLINNPVLGNADCIIVQNEQVRQAYISEIIKRCGSGSRLADNVFALGSPKTDKIYDICRNGIAVPEQWITGSRGKIKLFINTNVSLILNNNDRFVENMIRVFKILIRRGDVFVIWREHPLTYETLKSMRPGMLDAYNKLKSIFLRSGLGVMDTNPEAYEAIFFSDCYFGAGGSLAPIYAVTGKPMLVTAYNYPGNISEKTAPLTSLLKQVDRSLYFSERYVNFLDLFLDNLQLLDEYKEKRFEFLSQITVNIDGTVGSSIMKQVKELLLS